MSTLGFGNVHVFVATLEFELERLRRQAARERMLRALETETAQPVRTDRPSWHRHGPRTPHLRGAH